MQRAGPAVTATWVDLIRDRAGETPTRPAFTFLHDGEVESAALTYGELDQRARAIAAGLQQAGAQPGARALLVFPPGLDFISAFLGCLYAGVAAVPAYPPRLGRRGRDDRRLEIIASDARPRWVLTTTGLASRREELATARPALAATHWLATDEPADDAALADAWRPPELRAEDLAFLQYTSGSTADPKGVRITHRNLLHNQEMIRRAFGQTADARIVGWLPLYHDMGLIGNVLQPLYVGAQAVLLSPQAFLQRPLRWLQAISHYRATTSGGPDFAFDLCVRRIPEAARQGLDLSSWRVAFNGAEPVRATTLERFARAFAPYGFAGHAFFPCYGLAEATLFATGGPAQQAPHVVAFETVALEAHRVAIWEADEAADEATTTREDVRRLVGCGQPGVGQQVVIVDEITRTVAAENRVGEIWLASPSIADGYWQRPEETARDFAAHLAADDEGTRGPFLRTGDLGFLHDGALFITGRRKDLIILRGRNHYPQDLERSAEASHPDLRSGGGAAFSIDVGGREQLVLVLECERRANATVETVAAAVRQAVAATHEAQVYEVVLIRAGTLPRTSSGKVRRHACRQAHGAGSLAEVGRNTVGQGRAEEVDGAVDGKASTTPTRDALRQQVARLAGVEPDAIDDNAPLLALGFDSLTTIELRNALEEAHGAAPSLARLLEGMSLAELATALIAPQATDETARPAVIATAGDTTPLSYGQRALWFLEQLTPGTTAFVLFGAARTTFSTASEQLDSNALRRALARIAARHPALRTVIAVKEAGAPQQRVLAPEVAPPPELWEEETSGWSPAQRAVRLEEVAYRPFDLAAGPLLRLGLFTRLPATEAGSGQGDDAQANGEQVLFLAVHHLVSDLWSLALLLRELETLYADECGGPTARLAPVPLGYSDYACWQERLLAAPAGEALWRYWRQQLDGAPLTLDLPTDRPRPAVQSARGAFASTSLAAADLAAIGTLGRQHGATLYMSLLAAFAGLLQRYSGQKDFLLGSPTTGRSTAALAGVMGYFINPVVVRADLGGAPDFTDLLGRIRRTVLAAFAHQDFPFPLLAERLQPQRDASRSPIFQVFFVMEQAWQLDRRGLSAFALGEAGAPLELFGRPFTSLQQPRRSAQFDLMMLLARRGDGLAIGLEYNPDLFDTTTVRRLLGHYCALLRAAVADPRGAVAALPMLSAAERTQLVVAWNRRGPAPGSDVEPARLDALFAAQVARDPNAIAVICEVEEITYGQLAARAADLAHRLRAAGVGPEVPVGLCLSPGIDLVVGLLGILGAGGAYVPFDPAYPRERLASMFDDTFASARPVVVVAERGAATYLPLPAEARLLHPDATPPDDVGHQDDVGHKNTGSEAPGGDDHLAYIIYTSGSTGRPKGVGISHRNAVRLLRATEPWFRFGPGDVWTFFHAAAFDFSVWEIWGALAYGGRLVVVPPLVGRDPEAFGELLAVEGVTVLNQTPSAFTSLAATEASTTTPALRLVIFGGEALPRESLRPWAAQRGTAAPHLVNMYGITETTVHATYRPLQADDLTTPGAAPLGEPLPDLWLYLFDRRGGLSPLGVPGEIHVGGAGVARGYRGQPALTAARFVPDPFATRPGARLYRSGDLARYRSDGELIYLGRIDHQVKVRGFRIELGEIEAALATQAGVRQAVVVAMPEPRDTGQRLVAYVVGEALEPTTLRDALQQRLPDYMVPAAVVTLEHFPRTANNKVDRQALPAPETALRTTAAAAPQTDLEEALAVIWHEVLGVEAVGVEDDFFALGGHSLKATELIDRIADTLGVKLPLQTLFAAPTVAGLARAVEAAGGEAPVVQALPSWRAAPAARHDPFPLTDIQQAYWIGRSGAFELGTVSTQSYVEIDAEHLDLPRLEEAWQALIARHDMLRAVVLPSGEQRVLPDVPPYRIALLDLRGRPAEEMEQALAEIRARMSHEVLAAERWPLFEIRATRLEGERVRLHARLDALIYDAWSAHILLGEWMLRYRDREAELPPLAITFRDYVLTARALREGETFRRARAYWLERLDDLPPAPELPLHRDPAGLTEHRFTRRTLRLEPTRWERLQERARRVGLAPSGLLLAAYSEVLAAWSKHPCFTLNVTLFQRLPLHPQVDRVVGDFTSLTLLEVAADGRQGFAAGARRLQEQLWKDLDHSSFGGVEVLRALARHRGGPVGMPVVFTSTLGLAAELDLAALPGPLVYSITQTSQVWLDHQVSEEGGALVTNWDAVDALFPPGLLDDLFAAYSRLLALLGEEDAAWDEPPPSHLPRLLPAAALQARQAANTTAAPLSPRLLHELFLERAAAQPAAPAVIGADRVLTYEEVRVHALALAHRLRRDGATPDTLVAVAMEKGWEQVVAVLAVLMAGAAYLPVDPGLPAARFTHLLARGAVRLALTQAGLATKLPWPQNIAVLVVDSQGSNIAAAMTLSPLSRLPSAEELAYVIFTSGSTGEPKGVMIEHRGAVNTVLDINDRFRITPADRILALSSLSFDLSVYDIFGTLAAGAAIVMPAPHDGREPRAWAERVVRDGVTVWNSVPALLGLWTESIAGRPELHPRSLRLAMLSGDWIPITLPERARARAPGLEVVSLGGATEASIWSILHPIDAIDPSWASIPYGKPMINQRFHVLDADLAPRPAWVPGELYIAGIGLARGYWRDEGRTAASFFRHPRSGERLYRTGDLGRYLPDGTIELLGREDQQVKVQGYRVELGEIESVLLRHPAVDATVVTATGAPRGERRLVAHVVPPPIGTGEPETRRVALRAHLSARLPTYMVPATFVFIEALPRTANGKVDRRALAAVGAVEDAPVTSPTATASTPAAPPTDGIAARLAELVVEVLGAETALPEPLPAESNLLELGATSLEIMRLANRLETELGTRPSVQAFYEEPTLAALTRFYAHDETPAEATPVAPVGMATPGLPAFDVLLDPDEREAFKKQQPGLRPLDDRPAVSLDNNSLPPTLAARYGKRISHRHFAADAIPLARLGTLLACLGQRAEQETPLYYYPSAGGLYPVQVYLHIKEDRIDGLDTGTYYHHPATHRLLPLAPGVELDPGIHDPFINQPTFDEAAFSLFFVAQLAAIAPIYGEQALPFATLEAGYMGQLLMMHAPSVELGLCPIGIVDFARIRAHFALDASHLLVHSMVGGAIAEEGAPKRRAVQLEAPPAWNITIDGDREEGEL